MAQSYSVEAILSAVDRGFSSTFKAAADSTQTLSQKTGSTMTAIGKASTVMGLAIGAMSVGAIRSYGNFQEAINKAAVIGGSSNKQLSANMKDLENEALSLGKTLPISAKDAANAMVEMARNGASVGELKKEFPAIAKAAAVSGEDITQTATTVQQAMNIWGGGAKNAAKDSAILAIVANRSNAQIGDMQQVFANVGTAAKNMGFSLKDVAIAAGVMSNASVPAAQASMDLNNAFTHMVKPSKAASGEMKKLGLSYTTASGEMKPLKTIINDVATATKGMSGAQKTAALNTLFGAAGAKAIAPLLDSVGKKAKKSGKGWDAFSSAIEKGAGSTAKANKYLSENSQNMTKNVGQSLDQMVDAFDALVKTSIGSIAPQIQAVAKALGSFATWLTTSKSPMASFVKGLIAWSPVIAGVLIVLGLLSTGIGKLITAFSAPTKAIKAFGKGAGSTGKLAGQSGGQIAAMGVKALGVGAGIGLAAAGLGVFAMGIAKLASTGKAGIVALAAMTASIVVLAGVFALLGSRLNMALPGMLGLSVVMLSAGAGALMFGGAIALAGEGVKLASTGVLLLVQAFVLLGQNMALIIPTLSALGTGFALMLQNFILGVTAIIPQLIAMFISMVQQLLAQLAAAIPSFMASGVQIIVGIINGIATGMPQIVAAATNLIVNFLGALTAALPRLIAAGVSFIVALLEGIAQNIGKLITAGTDALVNFLEGVANNLPRVINAGVDVIVAFIEGIANNLSRIINAGLDLLAKFIMGIVNAIPRLAGIAVQAVEKFVYGVGNALGQVLGSGTKLIGMFVKGILDGISKSQNAGKNNGDAVKNGVSGINLFSHGAAIINSFLSGLKSAYGAVKDFVGGIAGWIKDHKGPISYDKRLLIPAGNAIMQGLNSGLSDEFKSVQNTVSSMATMIANSAAVTLPSINASNFNASLKQLNSKLASSSLNDQLNVNYTQGMTFETHVDLNGREIALATVDDMTEIQNRKNTEYNRVRGYRS